MDFIYMQHFYFLFVIYSLKCMHRLIVLICKYLYFDNSQVINSIVFQDYLEKDFPLVTCYLFLLKITNFKTPTASTIKISHSSKAQKIIPWVLFLSTINMFATIVQSPNQTFKHYEAIWPWHIIHLSPSVATSVRGHSLPGGSSSSISVHIWCPLSPASVEQSLNINITWRGMW